MASRACIYERLVGSGANKQWEMADRTIFKECRLRGAEYVRTTVGNALSKGSITAGETGSVWVEVIKDTGKAGSYTLSLMSTPIPGLTFRAAIIGPLTSTASHPATLNVCSSTFIRSTISTEHR